ncbi:hypothetical protein MNB_SV-12-819 [hydrothermal vent metagenome]|uniref:Outer membrane protein beta-barrel domain-containing protein n=1 Tax=hydrothermal vent metagenome TaxID=652676 RepID=A0A1W1CF15_9ZZZZ
MKKEILASLLVASLATSLQAGGDIGGVVSIENEVAPVEVVVPTKEPVKVAPKKVVEPKVEKKSNSNFYIVGKGLYTTGDTGLDAGYGAGLDLGYKLNDSLAVELGASFAKNEIEATGDDLETTTANLSLVYTVKATDSIGVFGKAGYMVEKVKDGDDDSGVAYGAGVKYNMSDATALVAEYQGSTIDDDPRGGTVSLGLMYNF